MMMVKLKDLMGQKQEGIFDTSPLALMVYMYKQDLSCYDHSQKSILLREEEIYKEAMANIKRQDHERKRWAANRQRPIHLAQQKKSSIKASAHYSCMHPSYICVCVCVWKDES